MPFFMVCTFFSAKKQRPHKTLGRTSSYEEARPILFLKIFILQ